jgi:hypothetical protein
MAPRTPPARCRPDRVIVRRSRRRHVSSRAWDSSGSAPGSSPASSSISSTSPSCSFQSPRAAGSTITRKQFVATHGPDVLLMRWAMSVAQAVVLGEAGVEVGPQGNDDADGVGWRPDRRPRQVVEQRPPLGRVAGQGEDLLELVDDQQQARALLRRQQATGRPTSAPGSAASCARQWPSRVASGEVAVRATARASSGWAVGVSRRYGPAAWSRLGAGRHRPAVGPAQGGDETGADDRRLAAARRADDGQERPRRAAAQPARSSGERGRRTAPRPARG